MSSFLQVFFSRIAPLGAGLLSVYSATADTLVLPPVVVTATRSPMSMLNRLNDVSVIDAEQIAQSGQSSVGELLQQQHGLELTTNGGPQSATGVFIRGANNAQTLVLIDGQRFGSATLGGASWNAIPLSQVDRIEILRGPSSSLYGADAIGGVVNIITRTGAGPVKFNAEVGAGSWNTFKAAAGLAGASNGLSYALQAANEKSDGYNSIIDTSNFSYNPDKDGYTRKSASGRLAYEWLAGHTLAAQFLYSDIDAQYDGSPTYNDRDHLKASSLSLSSSDQLLENWSSRLRVGQTVDNSTTDSDYPSHYKTEQRQFSWQNDVVLNKLSSISLGLEHLNEKVLTDYVGGSIPDSRHTNSLVAVYQLHVGEHRIQLNLRHDANSQYSGQTNGALQYGYDIMPGIRLTGSYGTGFRAPSFNELYYPGYGQTTIRPEKSRNTEIGLYLHRELFDANLVAYRNKVTDLIEYQSVCTTPGYPWGCAANISNATLEGISMSAQQTKDNTTVKWSWDYQNPTNDNTGLLLARRAKQHGMVSVLQKIDALTLGAELQANGRRYEDGNNTQAMGGYGVANLHLSYQIAPAWKVLARWNNITNKDYEIAKGYATPDSNVFLSIQFQQ